MGDSEVLCSVCRNIKIQAKNISLAFFHFHHNSSASLTCPPQIGPKRGGGVCRNPLKYQARYPERNWALLGGNVPYLLTSSLNATDKLGATMLNQLSYRLQTPRVVARQYC
jgi:hypothetical protein